MRYVSTRGDAPPASLAQAIRNGAAPDGGLYLPEEMPVADLSGLHAGMDLAQFAEAMLAPFFKGDVLESELAGICAEAFDFPVPLTVADPAKPGLRALELFHGPTGAFKDFGARFLMACFDRLGDPVDKPTILVATSGDTGGAVGCAAEGRESLRAVILYPRGRVSAFQELQLTCWDAPVRAIEVEGDFDDCQRLVKAAFADTAVSKAHRLSSANSINIGRLLPQMAYVAYSAVRMLAETGEKAGFIIPTGNLGHGFAAIYAKAMGFPIGPIVAVTNANKVLSQWHRSGIYEPAASLTTIANAMDVGAPSNFERLVHLPAEARTLHVEMVDDDTIRARIKLEYEASGYVWCPHSATAVEAYARLDDSQRAERHWVAAATAHPFKFADVIEPIVGRAIVAPPALRAIIGRTARKVSIAPELKALIAALDGEAALAA